MLIRSLPFDFTIYIQVDHLGLEYCLFVDRLVAFIERFRIIISKLSNVNITVNKMTEGLVASTILF